MAIVPGMAKRHFEFIAQTIQQVPDKEAREQCAAVFAEALRSTNGKFNAGRFEKACVPGANVKKRS